MDNKKINYSIKDVFAYLVISDLRPQNYFW